MEEVQQERRELQKAMRLLQEEKQQLQEEQKRLAREREQERETCSLLRSHNQVGGAAGGGGRVIWEGCDDGYARFLSRLVAILDYLIK